MSEQIQARDFGYIQVTQLEDGRPFRIEWCQDGGFDNHVYIYTLDQVAKILSDKIKGRPSPEAARRAAEDALAWATKWASHEPPVMNEAERGWMFAAREVKKILERKLPAHDSKKSLAATLCSKIAGYIGGYATEEQADKVYKLLCKSIPYSCSTDAHFPQAPVRGWEPIESAPKDDSPFLLYDSFRGKIGIGNYSPADPDGAYEACYWMDGVGSEAAAGVHFTHWMPLPAAPHPEDETGGNE